jgi:hypothetical protein
LIEVESCISLKHSKCWNPGAKLSSTRELGIGLGQITKAYNEDGSVRFDALTELRLKHPALLAEASWKTIQDRPDIQIRMVVLKSKDNYSYYVKSASSSLDALAFADAAYNGGVGGLNRERTACKLKSGCDPTKWFGHVELVCLKSKAILYGKRSACDINRDHVQDVLNIRSAKYSILLE